MHFKALLAGAVAGLLDVALIAVADPSAGGWVMAQSFLAWSITGWAVIVVPSQFPPMATAIVLTLVFNLPWFVALGPGAGRWEHVPPLVAMSVLFGSGLGLVRRGARSNATSAA